MMYAGKERFDSMSEHVCTPETCPEGSKYYVTAIDAGKTYFMAGPYNTHIEALNNVDKSLQVADKHDGRAWFMAWGTVQMKSYCAIVGSLNKAGFISSDGWWKV